MKASSLLQHESTFRQTGIDSSGTKFLLKDEIVNIGDKTGGKITLVDAPKEIADNSYFYEEEFPKERIVLHFTAGYLKGDVAQLTRQGVEVSVPFLISRSGHIYNFWKSKYWSYHLGPGTMGGNTEMSRSSIAIEISNIGYLHRKPNGQLYTTYSTSDIYCTEAETAYYQKLAAPYRGEKYFAKFTLAQYNSLILLLRFLTAKYKIPRVFLPAATRYNTFASPETAANFKGICSHVNFRPSGKWDIGPAFDWERVIAGLDKP